MRHYNMWTLVRSLCVVACVSTSFLSVTEYSVINMYPFLFVHWLLIFRLFLLFWLFCYINIYVCTSFCVDINFHFSGSRVAESCGLCVFSIWRNCSALFHSGGTISHSASYAVWGPSFLHCLVGTYHCLASIVAILWDVAWHLTAVLICISLTVDHVGHFFMCLLATCIFSDPLPIEKM